MGTRAHVFARSTQTGKTYYVGWRDRNGRYRRKKVGKSKTLAKKLAGDIEAKLERGEAGLEKKDYPIEKFFKEYQTRTEPRLSASYHRRNQQIFDHIARFLEDTKRGHITRLSQLTPGLIEEYQAHRMKQKAAQTKKPITKRTVNIEVSSLKTALNKAVKWGLLVSNPLQGIEKLKEDDSKVIRALTQDEARELLTAADEWFKPILLVAMYTGLREGELIHLQWDDVDFDQRVIRIRRKAGWNPKSSGRNIREREIAIPSDLISFLKSYKKTHKNPNDEWVFHMRDGSQLRSGLRKNLMRLTKRLGFAEVTQFHALRHTYATHLIAACKDVTVAKELLGHVDIRTTMRYTDVTADRKRQAVELLSFTQVEDAGASE
ncbi:MAG: hypothetical protein AMXMBFR84_29410 [Candidatus Hydrogenedentota bacterium]